MSRDRPLHHRRPSRDHVRALASAVSAERGISLADVMSTNSRRHAVAHARWAVWAQLRAEGYGYSPIAAAFRCDHTSVMYGVGRLSKGGRA